MSVKECILYESWPSNLTGYPTVLDCRVEKNGDPLEAINTIYEYLSMISGVINERIIKDQERIGGEFLVYKEYVGNRKKPVIEIRSIYNLEKGNLQWAGAVSRIRIPGATNKPSYNPELEEPLNPNPPATPPGQKIIRKPVIYTAEGNYPKPNKILYIGYYDEKGYTPTVEIKVEELRGEWIERDFHCVTGWSVGKIKWRVARILDLLRDNGLKGSWIIGVSSGGYTAVFPYKEYILKEAYLATGINGGILPREHGGPVRLLLPRLYGWKSVKWLSGLYVSNIYLDGYWEARGYHWRGLITLNERFKQRW